MLNKKNRILAIDPGAREMGIVILDGSQLVHYGVKSLKKFRPEVQLKRKVKEILKRAIVEYEVKTLVVEAGWFSQIASPLFRAVIESTQEIVQEMKLNLASYAPQTIRRLFCINRKATKKNTTETLVAHYPELGPYLPQTKRSREKYWQHVFDALAAGLAHVMKSEEESRQ